jgi:hypothetical protein
METSSTNILDLPPEILQEIILSLDHSEILHLKNQNVCHRFNSVCTSSSVWRKVRFGVPTPLHILTSCLPLMENNTTDLLIRGFLRKKTTVSGKEKGDSGKSTVSGKEKGNLGKTTVRDKERGNLSQAYLEELAASCPGLKVPVLRIRDPVPF